ncbi:MAG: ribosome maturation factor RimP [Robiginitomaculum sp.]|nr:ribosome maturation factor RimP [Robiginitomaculum sp.]
MRAKTAIEQRVLTLIEPVCEELGLVPVRVRLMGREKNNILQIMAERPEDGMLGIGQCARLSRAISALIDVEDPVAGKYALEVSSPGLDRPLTLFEHFSKWQGNEAKIELDRLVEGRRRFRGKLVGIEDDNILIDLEGEEETTYIPFAWLSEARLIITDELLKQSAKARKQQISQAGEQENEH